MRSLYYVVTSVVLMALAFWAYDENYKTQQALKHARSLQNQIALKRERLGVLQAEWAYLNRPDRLRELAEINFGALELLPLHPDQFGQIDQIGFPPVATSGADEALGPILNPIEVSADLEASE